MVPFRLKLLPLSIFRLLPVIVLHYALVYFLTSAIFCPAVINFICASLSSSHWRVFTTFTMFLSLPLIVFSCLYVVDILWCY